MAKKRRPGKSFLENGKPATEAQALQPRLKHFLVHYDVIILFLFLFFCYNTVSDVTMSGDTIPAGLLPLALIDDHSLFFDGPFIQGLFSDTLHAPEVAYAFPEVHGHIVSFFPIVTPILVTPLYGFFSLLCWILNVPVTFPLVGAFAKTSASCIAAASCVVVYLTLKELFSQKTALITTCVYAFATSTWSVSSQALWQHGTVQLLLILMIYLVMRNEREQSQNTLIFLGLLTGLFIFNRPPDAVLLLPIIGYVVWYERKNLPVYALSAAAAGLPFLVYNLSIFGNVFGGYTQNLDFFAFGFDSMGNFMGLLIAPNVGLLVFSPVLVLSVFGYLKLHTISSVRIRQVLVVFGPAIVLEILVYSFFGLWGSSVAFSYGQRFLTGFIPVLAIFIGIIVNEYSIAGSKDFRKRAVRIAIILLIVSSVIIQAIGVFLYPLYPDRSTSPERTWDWNHSIVIESYRFGISRIPSITMMNVPPFPPLFEIPIHS
jgi:hypothetical protein